MTWRLAIPWWEGRVKANEEMQSKAKLKVEAKDNDLATNKSQSGRVKWMQRQMLKHKQR